MIRTVRADPARATWAVRATSAVTTCTSICTLSQSSKGEEDADSAFRISSEASSADFPKPNRDLNRWRAIRPARPHRRRLHACLCKGLVRHQPLALRKNVLARFIERHQVRGVFGLHVRGLNALQEAVDVDADSKTLLEQEMVKVSEFVGTID